MLVLLGAWLEIGPLPAPAHAPRPPALPPPPPPAIVRSYEPALARLERDRSSLALRWHAATETTERRDVLDETRVTLRSAILNDIVPAWFGTRWSYHGTSETPGRGSIACGYFVATVLRDAGFVIERRPLAQKGSAEIVRDLVPAAEITDREGLTPAEVIAEAGDGLHVIGFDSHVGLLVVEGRRAEICHSSNRAPKTVRCEDARTARSMTSSRHVFGPLLTDDAVRAWLDRRATLHAHRP